MLSTHTKIRMAKGLSQAIRLGRRLAGLDHCTEVVRGGLRWRVDLCEGIDLAIYLGRFETESVSVIRRLLSPGAVALDIGANIGAHTLPMARSVGPDGKVYAFEPTQFAFRKLQKNLELNADLKTRVVLEQMMLGDSTTGLPDRIYSSWPLIHGSGAHERHGGRLMCTTGAQTCSVDQYVREAGIRRLDLIKIDVDGYECAVLHGAQSTLTSLRPPIVMEFAPYVLNEVGASVEGLCEILRRYRYHLYTASTGQMLPVAVERVNKFLPDGCGINILCVPSEKRAGLGRLLHRDMPGRLVSVPGGIQAGLLSVYRLALNSGVLSTKLGNRVFERTYLIYKEVFEASHIRRLKDLVTPGTTIIDVGAFIGFFSLRFAQWVSDSGRVMALEPDPTSLARLRSRVERAGLTSVVDCIQAAVAQESGERRLTLNVDCPVDHKLGEDGIPVNTTTIDDLLAAFGWPPVSLIKIDVQGAEASVIAGARRTIATYHPSLLVEVSDATLQAYGSSAETLLSTLAGFGYTIHRLDRHKISEAVTIKQALHWQESSGYIDLLFLHDRTARSVYTRSAA
ncbi:MAG TPA: FkbM family methyltransferase [Nitrospira sp.]|nr:FkbM family methyltransferase [Nitrospira sp.]